MDHPFFRALLLAWCTRQLPSIEVEDLLKISIIWVSMSSLFNTHHLRFTISYNISLIYQGAASKRRWYTTSKGNEIVSVGHPITTVMSVPHQDVGLLQLYTGSTYNNNKERECPKSLVVILIHSLSDNRIQRD